MLHNGHWCSVAVQADDEASKFVILQVLYWGHWRGVRVELYEGHGIESRICKNCDKFLYFIVRVSV